MRSLLKNDKLNNEEAQFEVDLETTLLRNLVIYVGSKKPLFFYYFKG